MERVLNTLARCACSGTPPAAQDGTPPRSRSPVSPSPQTPPCDEQVDASHLGHLQNILDAHLRRDRTKTQVQVLDWKYDGPWNVEENARQVLRTGPAKLRATGMHASALALRGEQAVPPHLHHEYAELLKALIAVGLDLCTVRSIPLEMAYRTLLGYETEMRELQDERRTDGYDAAYRHIAPRYLEGLVQARVCEQKLKRSLDHLCTENGSLLNLCPTSASAIHLNNRHDSLHLLANYAPAYFLHEDIEHFYRQRRDDGSWYGLEGVLRHHEVNHPGSTAAATMAMSLVLDKLVEGHDVGLAWLDGVRDTLGAYTSLAAAAPLCSPAPGGELMPARVMALLAQYKAAMDARMPQDTRATYRAIAALCCGLYRLRPYGEDLGLVSTVLLQYLLLRHGLPAVAQQNPHILSQPDTSVAVLLETCATRQRVTIAALEPRYLEGGGSPDADARPSAASRPAAFPSAR